MTHEFKFIVDQAKIWQSQGKPMVLATVVEIEGSSYRRPGVRMILTEEGESVGAVSGGCVEKEVHFQSLSVIENAKPKMMSYDGTLRLGCEGIIYVLLEPFELSDNFIKAFDLALKNRSSMIIQASYQKEFGVFDNIGSCIIIDNQTFVFNKNYSPKNNQLLFKQELPPLFQLIIIGAEHDAVQLTKTASGIGWKVIVIASADEQKSINFFPGAADFRTPFFEDIDTTVVDKQTAIVLMTHSFNKDVQYLLAFNNCYPAYFGLLGPQHRKERLISQLLELNPEIDFEFIDQLRGPSGINIGAESAQEIAISIISEILSVIRNQKPILLKDKEGNIHA